LLTKNEERAKVRFLFIPIVCVLILFSIPVRYVQLLAGEIKQPINFNHKTHVNDNMIPCEFCHVYAFRSEVAGLPPVQSCIGCHIVIKGSNAEQQRDIDEIFSKFVNKNKPIPWKKINDLPDFVYFSHKRHLIVGFGCFECHGNVNMMATPVLTEKNGQVPLSMGWCLKCHKTEHQMLKVQSDISRLVGTAGDENKKELTLKKISVKGSKDCLTCHK